MTVEGRTNTDGFLTCLDQVLCPALRPGQTVGLDNLSVHKIKAFLRKAQARTQEALESAIAAGLATITAQDAQGWFQHCEFPLPFQSR